MTTLLVLALATTACGGGDAAPEEAAGTTSAPVEAETSTEDPPTEVADASGSAFAGGCAAALGEFGDISSAFGQGAAAAMGGDVDGATYADQLDELAANAPDEIQADFEVLTGELGPFFRALGELDITAGGTPSPDQVAELQSLSQDLDSAAVEEASANIDTWFQENC